MTDLDASDSMTDSAGRADATALTDPVALTNVTVPALPTLLPVNDFVPDDEARREEMQAYRGILGIAGRRVAQPPVGSGVSTILVPGFVSGDIAMTVLARHLRRHGNRTFRSEIGANLGCSEDMVQRLLRRVEQVAADEGRRVALVGHSRGGMIVKAVALRRPDLVQGIVVLSAPVTGNLSVATHVRRELEGLFRLNRRGFTRFMSEDCVTGECAARVVEEFQRPFPENVSYLSVYSPRDAIIDWHSCLDPAAELIELPVAHTGMAFDPRVLAVVAERLASPAFRAFAG